MYMYRRGYNTPKLKEIHHIEDLKKESDRVLDEFKSIERERQELQKILDNITLRAAEVLQYNYTFKCECRRREEYNTKHIFYELVVYKIPVTESKDHYTRKQIHYEKIPGKNGGKKLAIKRIEQLKKEYNCIELEYFFMEGRR